MKRYMCDEDLVWRTLDEWLEIEAREKANDERIRQDVKDHGIVGSISPTISKKSCYSDTLCK